VKNPGSLPGFRLAITQGRRSGDEPLVHDLAVLDDIIVDAAGHVAGFVELQLAGRTLIVDVGSRLDQFDGLGPFAGLDDLAGRARYLPQRLRQAFTVGAAVLLDGEGQSEDRVIGLRTVDGAGILARGAGDARIDL